MQTGPSFRSRYDAIVVGARAAGAATAMLLARAGLSVLAVDRGRLGDDTLSTHALMRGAVLQLHRWGLLRALQAAGTPPIRSATFHYGEEEILVPIKARDGIDALYAPRRTVLDPLIVRAAAAAGAEVVHGVTAVDLVRDARGRVAGAVLAGAGGRTTRVEADVVVGADGIRSPVARLAGAPVERAGRSATAVVYGHFAGLALDGYHWYYRPGVSAGAIPTNDGRACVFVALPPARFLRELRGGLDALYRRALAEATPELAPAVASARLDAKLRSFPGTTGFLRRAWGPGWALVGDAGYFKDPLTAHGLTDALRDAELLSRAIVAGTDDALAGYQATRDELSLGLFEVTDRVASFAWDLDQAKRDHHLLARHMAGETEMLLALDREPARAEAV
ncbi:NAD(P)/FAD-dependent oxidoreductase [Anaeromyxobacter oryzae]|uniref:FAD-dependent oxidoreductase n=1 Tax=Anaeromyxobacter oryzae TaxID=2918170 RepID=A0ABM7WPU0_9BACT|nr:FAD-dependent monooxygenase [Anaeromyxobacter oryzae]BDG01484.1 FAD-dependent oxidoreductase [Anaeromyxobacter oryzae]